MNLQGRKFENNRLDMEIFVYEIDGKEWFIGNDMSILLGYSNYQKALQQHVWKENKKSMYIKTLENIGNTPNKGTLINVNNNKLFINEIGLYQLIFGSKLDKAREFQKWVFEEVLPSLRKHGAYVDDKFENTNAQEKYLKMKSITLLMCEKKEFYLSTASEIIFNGNKSYLKKYLVENGFINEEETEVYKEFAKDADDKVYPMFLKKRTENVKKGVKVVRNRIALTGYGMAHFLNKLMKI